MRFTATFLAALTALPAVADDPRAGPNWWALQPIARSTPPRGPGPTGVGSPIDAFLRARLTEAGLRPAPPSDRRALIRRVTFDLTGLPPTPAEIEDFLADQSVTAFAKVVDRLLASPAYGERWARHWLDVVRFSESHGFEYDRLRENAWPYRDYVIRTLNEDRPFADFVVEQLAGDVLPEAGRDGVIATGMMVAGPYDQAGMGSASTVVRSRAREDELEDMLGTIGQSFLGVTLNCARCHDHKVDPYSSRDYYRMRAVFAGVHPGDRPTDGPDELKRREQEVARLARQLADLRTRMAGLELRARERVLADRGPKAAVRDLPIPTARWTFDEDGRDAIGSLHAELKGGAKILGGRLHTDGQKAFAETLPLSFDLGAKTLEAWVALPTVHQAGGGAMSLQTLDGAVFDAIVFAERKPLQWIAGSDFFARTRDLGGPDETARPGDPIHLAITYDTTGRISVYRNGRPYGDSYIPGGDRGKVSFAAKQSQIVFGLRHRGGGRAFLKAEIEEARLYNRALTADEILASFRGGVQQISLEQLRAAMSEDERDSHRRAEAEAAGAEIALSRLRSPTITYAAKPRQPGPSTIYRRGDPEKPGDPVTGGSPAAISGPPHVNLPADTPEAERRRQFAQWVVHPDNPLTWRVMVNRVWQYHFGEGLVRTPNDFGFNGDRPTHPEMLDWLAATFRDGGGRLKSLHRLIVLSDTYQQSTRFDPEAAEKDADNRLLWRYPPRRLEAEAVRDALLAVSGKLNRQAGGPSVRPFRVETFNSAFYIPIDDDRPDFNRRSVYRMNVTSSRDPVLDVLDCPDPSVRTPRRSATTTPLQALTLMNNPFTDRLTAAFAARLIREAGQEPASQVIHGYRLAFGRPPTDAERERAIAVARSAGLKAVCWALFNASEFVYLR